MLTFLGYVRRNLGRQKTRTALAALGVMLGVWLVVLFASIAEGALRTAESMLTQFGEDFHVYRAGVADQFLSTLPEGATRDRLRSVPGVSRTASLLGWVGRAKRTPFLYIMGLRTDEFALESLLPGPVPDLSPRDGREGVLAGESLLSREGVEIGGTIEVGEVTFRVAGSFRTGQPLFDNALVMDLQALRNRFLGGADIANFLAVQVDEDADPEEVAARVEAGDGGVCVVRTIAELGKVDQGFARMKTWSIVITGVATGLGWLFVMLAMVMAVYERTREIGVLRAVGWTTGRIVLMVLAEALLLAAAGAAIGIPTGFAGVKAIAVLTDLGNYLRPQWGAALLAKSALVALLAAGIGSIYPAWRASRLRPVEAIRHE